MLVGEKVHLTPLDRANAEKARHWINNPDVNRWLLSGNIPVSAESEAEFYNDAERRYEAKTGFIFEIHAIDGPRYVGNCGLEKVDQLLLDVGHAGQCDALNGEVQDVRRGLRAEGPVRSANPAREGPRPVRSLRDLVKDLPGPWIHGVQVAAVELCKDALTSENGGGQNVLPRRRHDRQGGQSRAQGNSGVDAEVVAGQSDDRRDQRNESATSRIGDAVVDEPGQVCEEWMGARRVIAPALASKKRSHLHEAGASAWVAVLAARKNRHQHWCGIRMGHGVLPNVPGP